VVSLSLLGQRVFGQGRRLPMSEEPIRINRRKGEARNLPQKHG